MLSLGLTGGIAAGKSLLSDRFRDLGALVIDADQLAREVVAPDSPGLRAVVEHFGAGMLLADGALNRPALGAMVFSDKAQLAALNAITHPLVREAATALKSSAGPGTIVVQDIPLLVETGQGPAFHLVVVAQAPLESRLRRMMTDRGMSYEDAMARIGAQASDEQRMSAADVVIVNDGTREDALGALDALWFDRLVPFAVNLAAGIPATASPDASTVHAAAASVPLEEGARDRLLARLHLAVGASAEIVPPRSAHGPVFVIEAARGTSRGSLLAALATAGYFPLPQGGGSTLLASADPGQHATIELVAAPL